MLHAQRAELMQRWHVIQEELIPELGAEVAAILNSNTTIIILF
jgi:hypothetical protein